MRHGSSFVGGALLLLVIACGGGNANEQPPVVVVPNQPVAPAATTSAPALSAETPVAATPPKVAVLPFKCFGGGTQRFEIGGRSYCTYTDPETWEGAERRCVANGGHLLTLETSKVSEAIHRDLGSPISEVGRAAWIGLEKDKRVPSGKRWQFIDGSAVDNVNAFWNANEPNNFDGNEGCGEWLAVNGRWNDTRCDLKQPYLCQEAKPGKPPACKNGGRAFADSRGKNLCINNAAKTFAEAKKACDQDGGTLATFKSLSESESLRDSMAQRFAAKRMWIGATDSADEGTWTWISGTPFDWQNWKPGEPNNFNREDCAELHSDVWQWNDMDCGMKLPSVCESPPK